MMHSIERGMSAMKQFAEQITAYNVIKTRAIGTAALREAKNGKEVADRFTAATGLTIEIIDGHREAGYILNGIKAAIPPLDKPGLIMDIGGGSVEFILFNGDMCFSRVAIRSGWLSCTGVSTIQILCLKEKSTPWKPC